MTTRRTSVTLAATGAGSLVLALLMPTAASARGGGGCEDRVNDTYGELLECVTYRGVRQHQAEFQKIADNSSDPVYPGTRAAGTEGYDKSAEYVAGLLEDA